MEIKDLAGLGELGTRLVEVVNENFGKFWAPTLQRKSADAKAYEMRTLVTEMRALGIEPKQLEYDGDALKITSEPGEPYIVGTAIEMTEEQPALSVRAAERVRYQQAIEQQNIECVIALAASQLSDTDEAPDERPDPDWTKRFFDYAAGVSNEDIQVLWARILAGEIARPGSFSLRTLDTLRNLSSTEAKVFVKLSNYVIAANKTYFLISPAELDNELRDLYTFEDIMVCSASGLVFDHPLTYTIYSNDLSLTALVYGNVALGLEWGEPSVSVKFPITALTQTGTEIMRLLDITPNIDYLTNVAKKIKSDKVAIFWSQIINAADSEIQFSDRNYL